VIEETITIFRNKKPKNLNFWVFLGFLKKPKKPRFFKSDFYSPCTNVQTAKINSFTFRKDISQHVVKHFEPMNKKKEQKKNNEQKKTNEEALEAAATEKELREH